MTELLDLSLPMQGGTEINFEPALSSGSPAWVQTEPPEKNEALRLSGYIEPWWYEREAVLAIQHATSENPEARHNAWLDLATHRAYRKELEEDAQARREQFQRSGIEDKNQFLVQEESDRIAKLVPGYDSLLPMRMAWDGLFGIGATAANTAMRARSTVQWLLGNYDESQRLQDEVDANHKFMAHLAEASGRYNKEAWLGFDVPIPLTGENHTKVLGIPLPFTGENYRTLNTADVAQGSARSLAMSGVAAGMGGFPAMLGAFGASTYDDARFQAKAQGLDDDQSALYAALSATFEVGVTAAFQRLGMGGLEDQLLGRVKPGLLQFVHEGAEESAIYALQKTAGHLSGVDEVTSPQEVIADLANVWAQTGAAVGSMQAAQRATLPNFDEAMTAADSLRQTLEQVKEIAAHEKLQAQKQVVDRTKVEEFATENPEAAARVASLPEEPSRKEFAEASGLEPGERSTAEFRKQFRQATIDYFEGVKAGEAEAKAEEEARQAVEEQTYQWQSHEEITSPATNPDPRLRGQYKQLLTSLRDSINERRRDMVEAYKALMPADPNRRGAFLRKLRRIYNKGGDPNDVRFFDELVQSARNNYAHIFGGGEGAEGGNLSDIENAVWEFILAGPPKLATVNSPEVVAHAEELYNAMREDDFNKGGSSSAEVEGVPFDTPHVVADTASSAQDPRSGRKPKVGTDRYVMDYLKRFPRRTALKPEHLNLEAVRPVASPEAKEIMDEIGVALRRRSVPKSFGGFKASTLEVLISPDTVRNPHLFHKVLMHELGHAIDFLGADKTLSRGNLAARFASLKQSMTRFAKGFDDKALREEALALSEWWKPGIHTRGKSFQKYRSSARELFADVMSVLLNSPADVKMRAPNLWKAWQKMLQEKPEFAEAYLAVQDLLGLGEDALGEHRSERLQQVFDHADRVLVQKMVEEEKARAGPLQALINYGSGPALNSLRKVKEAVQGTLIHKGAPIIAREKRALKEQPELIGDGLKAAYQLEKLYRVNGTIRAFADRVNQFVMKPVLDAGMTRHDIGQLLQHMRIVGARGDIANPGAYTPYESNRQIEFMKRRLGSEKYAKLREAVDQFHQLVYEVATRAKESGIVSQKFFDDVITPNAQNYAHFAVIEHITPNLPGSIKQMIGTFQDVGDPFLFTTLKMASVLHFAEINDSRKKLLAHAAQFVPSGDLAPYPLKTRNPYNAATNRAAYYSFQRSQQKYTEELLPGMERATVWIDGKAQDFASPAIYETMFHPAIRDESFAQAAAFAQQSLYGVFYPLYITYSPGFIVGNVFRDAQATWVRLGSYLEGRRRKEYKRLIDEGHTKKEAKAATRTIRLTAKDFLREMKHVMPEAWLAATNRYSELANEMHANRMLDPTFRTKERWVQEHFMGDAMLKRLEELGVLVKGKRTSAVGKAIDTVLDFTPDFVKKWGSVAAQVMPTAVDLTEIAHKMAGYRVLKKAGLSEDEIRYGVHNMVGTQNTKFRGAGSDILNATSMFWSARMAAWRAHANLARDPQSAASWAMRTAAMALPQVLLSKMAMLGYFGAALKAMMGDLADDDEERMWMIPLYRVRDPGDGMLKTVSFAIPRDQTAAVATTLLSKTFDAIYHKDPQRLTPVMNEMYDAVIGTESPTFELLGNWASYWTGGTPYDSFYDRPIVPDEVLQRGGWDAQRKMLAWSLKKFGGLGEFVRLGSSKLFGEAFEASLDTDLEASYRSVPGLSRLLRISNRGQTDEAYERQRIADEERLERNQGMSRYVADIHRQWSLLNRLRLSSERGLTDATPDETRRYQYLEYWRKAFYRPAFNRVTELTQQGYHDEAKAAWSELDRNTRLYMKMATADMDGDRQTYNRTFEELFGEKP